MTNSIIKYIRHRPEKFTIWIEGRNRVLVKVSYGPGKSGKKRTFYSVLGAKSISLLSCYYEKVSIGEYIVPVKMYTKKDGNQYLETYWDDENHGLRVIGNYVCDLFRQDLACVKLVKDHIEMFEWAHYRQPSIPQITVAKWVSDEDFKYIISKSNSKLFLAENVLSKKFRFENFDKRVDAIALNNCHWITVENIMSLNSCRIQVVDKRFTCKEMNRILKHWMNGGSPRLNHLRLYLDEVNEEKCLEGLKEYLIEGKPGERYFKALYGGDYTFNNVGLQRADGKIASFKISLDYILFIFVVWPDAKGRSFESFD
uniref:FBA_2 domain-containing protein n=2 Tax=Caenorhabditis tropicalis TaxID=1561998 RepID=A0A1I7SZD1_9PELO